MKELIAQLKSQFTYVILDTPPVNAVTDAAILAATADGTILVVEQGRTAFPALQHAKQLLDRVGAHTIGVVMNKVRSTSSSYSYEYGNFLRSQTMGWNLDRRNRHRGPVSSTGSLGPSTWRSAPRLKDAQRQP